MPTILQQNLAKYQQLVGELSALGNVRRLLPAEARIYYQTLNLLDAARIGLQHAIYSGGLIEDTLPFCKARNGKAFSLDEINQWSQAPDRPRIENYDPFIHLGGNRCHPDQAHCQHRLLFISKEEFERRIESR